MSIKSVKLIDIDKGWQALKKDLADLKDSYVKVGVQGAKGTEARPGEGGEPITNVDLAVIHEFGAPAANIPARPFVSGAFEKHRDEYMEMIKKGMVDVLDRKSTLKFNKRTLKFTRTESTVKRLLNLVGAKAAADMKNYVTQGRSPFVPNTPAVYKHKLEKSYQGPRLKEGPLGEPRPLVDSGRMIDSITWAVVMGSTITEGEEG